MTQGNDIAKIAALAELLLEHRLGLMRQAADRLDRSKMQVSAIDRAAEPADLPEVMAGLVACEYRRWADARKVELNGVMARQTADVLAARSEAETAFGRVQALRGIAEKLKGRP